MGPVQRALSEALESVASPELRVSIQTLALSRARLREVPERGPQVLDFVEGAWLSAVSDRLGREVGDELLEQVRPLLRFAARPRSKAPSMPAPLSSMQERPTLAAPPEPDIVGMLVPEASGARALASIPNFVLATADESFAGALEVRFGARATVVSSLMDLLDALDERDSTSMVAFDCYARPFQFASWLALVQDARTGVQFVTLGVTADDAEVMRGAGLMDATLHAERPMDPLDALLVLLPLDPVFKTG